MNTTKKQNQKSENNIIQNRTSQFNTKQYYTIQEKIVLQFSTLLTSKQYKKNTVLCILLKFRTVKN